MQTEDPCWLV